MANPQMMLSLRNAAKRLSLGGRSLLAQRMLRRCFRYARGKIRVDDFDGDLTISLSLSEHMQRRIFWMDYYNRDIIALLKRIMCPGMVFVDAGANIGEITLVAAKRTGKSGKVISFEPVNSIAEALEENVARNSLDQVTVARMGLSDANTTAPIYASCGQSDAQEENLGLGTLYGGNSEAIPLQIIELITLDSYLKQYPVPQVDIIKIDIEGAELPCLKGSENTLKYHKPLLIIEIQEQSSAAAGYSETDILDYLSPLGYTFQVIGRNGDLHPLDTRKLSGYQNVVCMPIPGTSSQPESAI